MKITKFPLNTDQNYK